jgi:outer membrane protein OmpA-like peptidoglycan-associated protein
MKYSLIFFFLFCSYLVFAQQKYSDEVYFGSGSDSLSAISMNHLDTLIRKITSDNKSIISISGHCDSIGNEKYNYDLSLKRAYSVERFIINKNIKPDSFLVSGYGENKPKYIGDEWGKNRRVEIVVTIIPPVKKSVITKKDTIKTVIASFVDTAKVGDKIALQNITFYGGTDEPMPESYNTLDELFTTLKNNPTIEICIEGHICCLNYDSENLSGKRAKAVYDYLVDKGINKKRLSCKGFGHTQPLTRERNEVERQMNRRVEIRITKK